MEDRCDFLTVHPPRRPLPCPRLRARRQRSSQPATHGLATSSQCWTASSNVEGVRECRLRLLGPYWGRAPSQSLTNPPPARQASQPGYSNGEVSEIRPNRRRCADREADRVSFVRMQVVSRQDQPSGGGRSAETYSLRGCTLEHREQTGKRKGISSRMTYPSVLDTVSVSCPDQAAATCSRAVRDPGGGARSVPLSRSGRPPLPAQGAIAAVPIA